MLRNIIKTIGKFNFANEVTSTTAKAASSANVTTYKDGQLVNRTSLILKKQEDIEQYVIKTVQGYFRTTHKNGILYLIQVLPKKVFLLNTVWTLWIQSKSQCKFNKI